VEAHAPPSIDRSVFEVLYSIPLLNVKEKKEKERGKKKEKDQTTVKTLGICWKRGNSTTSEWPEGCVANIVYKLNMVKHLMKLRGSLVNLKTPLSEQPNNQPEAERIAIQSEIQAHLM
jgi:hypothetical protein